MTIRELDELIHQMLSTGPKTAEAIHAKATGHCTLYDVQAALRIQIRNGQVKELGTGMYKPAGEEYR
jgi:hypothetical protein